MKKKTEDGYIRNIVQMKARTNFDHYGSNGMVGLGHVWIDTYWQVEDFDKARAHQPDDEFRIATVFIHECKC